MSRNIPLFDLNYDDSERNAVNRIMETGWISTGPAVNKFEEEFSKKIGMKSAVAVSSGTAALHLALKVIGVGKGDEVIVPALTFVATANVVLYVDAVPVFYDVRDKYTPVSSVHDIESLITSKTKAIIIMHYAGFPCEVDKIKELSSSFNIPLIEDSCHAMFTKYKGKMLGSFSDISCFSFYSNKNISTAEGGMLLSNNDEYTDKARLLRAHGMTSISYERESQKAGLYDVVDLGYNYRMDDIRASIGLVQLSKSEADLKGRRKVRDQYISELSSSKGVCLPFVNYNGLCSNYIMPVVMTGFCKKTRDEVRCDLINIKGIQTSVHYPLVVEFEVYKKYRKHVPNSEYFSENEISLPMFSSLKSDDVSYISESIKEIVGG